jgi:hypothetical protein
MSKEFSDKSKNNKFKITTPQGDVEIGWPTNQRPGFCPHCHKCIPLSSIVFKKEHEDGAEVFSGVEAVLKRKYGISKAESSSDNDHVGECPYCHKPIPVREIVFKKKTNHME